MPNNPVQIILNDQDFHQAPEPGQPPRNKDFFDGADAAFERHKTALLESLKQAKLEISEQEFGPAAYLKVQMRTEALAKSYRPVSYLFKPAQFPCVGADAVGTLYFRAPEFYLDALIRRVNEAEIVVETKFRQSDGESYKAPSAARAEVGAIDAIEIAPSVEKRQFSVAEAVRLLSDPASVSGYQIELFETPERREITDDVTGRRALLASLEQLLLGLGQGARTFIATEIGRTPVLELQLTRSDTRAIVDSGIGLSSGEATPAVRSAEADLNPDRHEAALSSLQAHPLVRAIRPPIQLTLADDPAWTSTMEVEDQGLDISNPVPQPNATYPRLGVIDSGISDILGDWIVDRFDYLDLSDCDPQHGTAVAGIAAMGQGINAPNLAPEPDGCLVYDAALFPKGNFMREYPKGFSDFLEELEQAVIEAKDAHGIRIFNLSINAISDVEASRYSIYAARLDQIADTHGVLFINSVGNLPKSQARAPWQAKPSVVKTYFANRTSPDTLQKPSESVRTLSVGALNPPGTAHIADAPTTYTRRGPGLQVGVKPDVAAYGGAGETNPAKTTGMSSLSVTGHKTKVVGTSFAAPLIARSAAELDTATAGGLTPEAIKAMMVHSAQMPDPLTKRGLKDIARQFAGYGRPCGAMEMLETDDHQVTLVFQSRLTIGERKPAILRFPFSWPQALVSGSSCSGKVRMTLAYAPPLDPAFGAEFVRVNLEASLKQRLIETKKDGGVRFANRAKPKYLPNAQGLAVPEKALISHGLKWWPLKQYEMTLNEVGETTDWRLEVTSLVRAETTFPADGVPFALVMTIEDPDGTQPVFSQVQQQLQSSRANAQALRSVFRLRPRA
ncbi:MAG: S8 family peptidase [Thalassovita sp.]